MIFKRRAPRIFLAMLMAFAAPIQAQEQSEQSSPNLEASRAGLPIMSADGQKVGEAISIEMHNGQLVLIGEFDRPLGIGTETAFISVDQVQEKGDHFVLAIPAEVIRDRMLGGRGTASRPLPLASH
jgi:hypothetical protein